MKTALNGMRFDSKTVLQDVHSGAKSVYVPSSPEAVHNGNPYCDPSCVLYLPGFPGSGATIYDFSGQGNHGTITGATWARLDSGLWVMNFDGTQYISMPTPPLAPSLNITGDITIIAWFYQTGATGIRNLVGNVAASNYGYRFLLATSTLIAYETHQLAASQASRAAVASVIDRWVMGAVTRTGATATIYENGLDVTSVFGVHVDPLPSLVVPVRIGVYPATFNTQYFIGNIAPVRVYNYALTSSQILKIYESERHLFGV